MMSAVFGIRADSTTSTVTRYPSSCGLTPTTDSGVRVVICWSCSKAARAALPAGIFGFGRRWVSRELFDEVVPSDSLDCDRFLVAVLLLELGRRVRVVLDSLSSVSCSVMVYCLFCSVAVHGIYSRSRR